MGVLKGDAGLVDQRRGGGRFPERDERGVSLPLIGLAAGITAAIVAWGYLVWLAIDLGRQARTGDSAAWGLLAVASLGAVACLFVGLLLLARLADAWRGSDVTDVAAESASGTGAAGAEVEPGVARPAPDLSRLVAAAPVEAAAANGSPATLPITLPEPEAPITVPESAVAIAVPEPAVAQLEAAPEPLAVTAALPALSLPAGIVDGAAAEPTDAPDSIEPAARTPYPGAGKRSSGRHAAPAQDAPAVVVPPGVAGKRRANV